MRKNIRLVSIIYFLSSLFFYLPVITLWFQSRGLSLFQITTLTSIFTVSIFIFNIPTGVVADKLGRKFAIVLAMIIRLISEVIFLVAHSYLIIAISYFLSGLAVAFSNGAIEALVYDSLAEDGKENEMNKTIGGIYSLYSLAFVVAPLAGIWLFMEMTPSRFALSIIFTIVSVFLALVLSVFLKEPQVEKPVEEKNTLSLLKDGIAIFRENRKLRRLLILATLTLAFGVYLMNLYQPYFVKAQVPGSWYAISLSISGLIEILVFRYAHKLEKIFGLERAFLIATLAPGFLYLAMAMVFSPIWSMVLFTINFGILEMKSPFVVDGVNRILPDHIRATAMSVIDTVGAAYLALMGMVIGRLADISLQLSFLVMGTIIVLSAVVFRMKKS